MKRFSNYAFWVALSGAVAVFLEDISNCLGLSINVSVIESLILSFCGVLVVLGIVNKKDDGASKTDELEDNKINPEIIDNMLTEDVESYGNIQLDNKNENSENTDSLDSVIIDMSKEENENIKK